MLDGDTFEVGVALPHYLMKEKLRLRGLDCPEIDTEAGRAAKLVVNGLVNEAEEVVVVTSKVDKYDRYLADVHLRLKTGEEIFLNNHLLAEGHAKPMGKLEQADWVP